MYITDGWLARTWQDEGPVSVLLHCISKVKSKIKDLKLIQNGNKTYRLWIHEQTLRNFYEEKSCFEVKLHLCVITGPPRIPLYQFDLCFQESSCMPNNECELTWHLSQPLLVQSHSAVLKCNCVVMWVEKVAVCTQSGHFRIHEVSDQIINSSQQRQREKCQFREQLPCLHLTPWNPLSPSQKHGLAQFNFPLVNWEIGMNERWYATFSTNKMYQLWV